VVFVEQERAIFAGINGNGTWLLHYLGGVLLYWTQRQDGSFADIQGHGLKVDSAVDSVTSFDSLPCPKIVPATLRKINRPRCRALLDHRRNHDASSPEILVAARDC